MSSDSKLLVTAVGAAGLTDSLDGTLDLAILDAPLVGRTLRLDVKVSDTVAQIKQRIEREGADDCPAAAQQRLHL